MVAAYASLDDEEGSDMIEGGGSLRGYKRRSDEDDDLWRPEGE